MRIRTVGQDRIGVPYHRAALRVCCALAVFLLLIFSFAAAESASPWEERLAAAREKYNEKTVHVYIRGQGRDQKGKINVCFYRAGKYIAICIRESLQITDEAEMEAVLEIVAKHKYFSEETYGSVSFLKAQWIAHNLAYGMATGSEKQQSLAGAIAGKGSKEIIRHAKELDLTPISEIPEKELEVYELVEYLYCKNE